MLGLLEGWDRRPREDPPGWIARPVTESRPNRDRPDKLKQVPSEPERRNRCRRVEFDHGCRLQYL